VESTPKMMTASRPQPDLSGHFPTEQATLKCVYLDTRTLDPTGTGKLLNAFTLTFSDPFPTAENY
jgi:putative transposase